MSFLQAEAPLCTERADDVELVIKPRSRDLGGFYVQPIRPGAVNLMTAGRGMVHSERTSEALLASGQRLHGIQTWMALPEADEEMEPAFEHVPGNELPVIEADWKQGRFAPVPGGDEIIPLPER